MEVVVRAGTLRNVTFSGDLENTSLEGNYDNCNFTKLNMRHVQLEGTFNNCDFRPAPGVARERVSWDGTYPGSTGVREG